jgi:hypothetical protein
MRHAFSSTPEVCTSPPSKRFAAGALRRRFLLLLLLVMPVLSARAGDNGYLPKAVDLFDRPAAGARSVGHLPRQQVVQVIGRAGSWANVKAGASSGWIRLIDLRLDAKASAQVVAVSGVKSVSGKTGIRGFSEEELMVGAPNRIEAGKLKGYAISAKDAAAFARTGNLAPRRQAYLEMLDYMPDGQPPEGFFDE